MYYYNYRKQLQLQIKIIENKVGQASHFLVKYLHYKDINKDACIDQMDYSFNF